MKLNYQDLSVSKTFEMANLQNKELVAKGLKSTNITLNPLYVNLEGNVFRAEATNRIYWHKECSLERDIENFLSVMFKIATQHNNTESLKYLNNYYLNKMQEFRSYTDAHELSGYDIMHWLNHNANIFLNKKCSYEQKDAYSKATLEIINSLLETKREIYEFLYQLFNKSQDFRKTITDLLKLMRHYHVTFFQNTIEDDDSFMHLPEVLDNEFLGYQKMFLKAAQDILVRLIGFDKIESQKYKTITTTKPNIYEEYFNEIIMGFDIVQLNHLFFDASKQNFFETNYDDFINLGKNREYEEEARWVLKNVPFSKRDAYLKR